MRAGIGEFTVIKLLPNVIPNLTKFQFHNHKRTRSTIISRRTSLCCYLQPHQADRAQITRAVD